MLKQTIRPYFVFLFLYASLAGIKLQAQENVQIIPVDSGWAANSVNAVVFRKNSIASDKNWQYIAFYNANKHLVLGKRKTGAAKFEIVTTSLKGNASDAHNAISIMVDGDGYLHVSWDHHNNALNYAKSIYPGSLQLTEKMPMTGLHEDKVSYPEFYYMPSGDLLFFYRDGGSGQGNLVLNVYSKKNKQWRQLHSNLVDGEGKRNAYWQACTDSRGSIHLSWVWRESPDVASNHDLCYARSDDGGLTWLKSTGEKYNLPLSATTAEYACFIPPNSELINQTSMVADANGNPFIATYWRSENDSIPQYRVVFKQNGQWQNNSLGFRKTGFSLSGQGTKKIPVSRPQIITWQAGNKQHAALIFRDTERGQKISAAITNDLASNNWTIKDLTRTSVGSWEPSFDTELWKRKKTLHLFMQKVEQVDGEGIAIIPPAMVNVLQWDPTIKNACRK
jgi:hypothetical protein